MGSVLAAGSPSPPPPAFAGVAGAGLTVPPGFGMPPVSPVSPSTEVTSVQSQEVTDSLPNPGTFDECHRKCKEVFPMQMEGVRLVVNKGLSNHFQFFPVMIGDMDNVGSLNAQVIHQISNSIRSKMAFQTQQHKFVSWQGDAEFRGKDFTATITLGNPNVLVGSGIVVTHYLQSLTPSLALGGELVYHRRPSEEGAVMSLVGRYTGTNYITTLTLGSAGAHASYYHKANEQLQLGVEFEASTRMQDTSVSFGYQLDVPKANLQFKGSVDSNWVVGATLEKKLLPLPLSLVLCSFLNHNKNKFQCGFGITIG
ncbi:mitochondrial import receptor subunit TOM40B isoform X2 [Phyllopteryx taeniolatus]|uniref:mitochondrial import receptor subunit TOM40B isoform X2 n=1 Tax=Phyllopteryx taeniolatus TaxID=161469 RepID=UPI002AD2CFF7|nr:mitochondrial import receptor subunit TOM40B isoform X2 [Phyllopteryx taeniolatus]